MADTEITWQGLTLGGDGPYILSEVTGWDDLVDLDDFSQPRARGHGEHVGNLYGRARVVTASGKIADSAARDELALALQAVSTVGSVMQELAVEMFGQRLTSGARLVRRSLPVARNYSVGEIPFALQWRCPDPLRYGPPQAPLSTGLPSSSGGLVYPLTYPLDYGVAGSSGQITLTNDGTADAGIQALVLGALPGGFEISAAGQRLNYPTAVPAGQTIWLDTAAGSVLVEGTADRRGELTQADWLLVPAGGSLTLQFTSLGGAYDPAAQLVVPGFRAAYW